MINYHRAGSGPALLLTHGIGERWQYWLPVLPLLTPHFDVVAVDLPGFGGSPALGGAVTPETLTAALTGLLQDLGWDRPHVAGISLGGYLALRLGGAGRVASVTAFSPAGLITAERRRVASRRLRVLRAAARGLTPMADRLTRTAPLRAALTGLNSHRGWRIPPDVLADDLRAIASAPGWAPTLAMLADTALSPTETAGLADLPVTVAFGRYDHILPFRHIQRDWLPPSVTWSRLPGCGHTPTWDDPGLTAATIRTTAGRS